MLCRDDRNFLLTPVLLSSFVIGQAQSPHMRVENESHRAIATSSASESLDVGSRSAGATAHAGKRKACGMRAIKYRLFLAFLLFGAAGFALVGKVVESKSSQELVLVSTQDETDLMGVRMNFERAGFTSVQTQSEVQAAIGDATRAVVVTPRGLALIADVAPELLSRGVLLGGLNVSLHEILPLADPQAEVRDGWLRSSGEREIFSLVYRTRCAESRFSDWLDNWDPVALTIRRADVAAAVRVEHQALACDRNQALPR